MVDQIPRFRITIITANAGISSKAFFETQWIAAGNGAESIGC